MHLAVYGIYRFKKTDPKKSFGHYFLIYRWKSVKLQKYFWLDNCKQHTKISKSFNSPVRIYRSCSKWPSFKPLHFFKRIAKFNNYAFANRPKTGPDFFANANLYLRNVLGFVGKHPILQITPEEESWGLKSRLWGARSNFWLLSAIFSTISFISATVSYCFVCIRYGYLFKSSTITFLMLKFKDWLRRWSDHFGLRPTDSCIISTI